MASAAYYNEFDPYAAQWLRNLIAAGHIAPGDVDERSIIDVRADDLRGYRQCHFFAGIGVWSYALRKAGWSDEDEVWTGSCPCQPFSAAGKGEAFDDERDLWPAFFALIRERRPVVVAGEQVASRLGLAWLDAVHADLESQAYTVGAVDTCSAGVGSPNIRQRIYWLAHSNSGAAGEHARKLSGDEGQHGVGAPHGDNRIERGGAALRLGEPGGARLEGLAGDVYDGCQPGRVGAVEAGPVTEASESRGMAVAGEGGCAIERASRLHEDWKPRHHVAGRGEVGDRPGPLNGFWRAADWLCCTDGRWRPVESGSFPLATGAPARLGRLRAYGNTINAEVATEFMRACRGLMP